MMFNSVSKFLAFCGAVAALTATAVLGQGEVCLVFTPPEYNPILTAAVTDCKTQLSSSQEAAVQCTADFSQAESYDNLMKGCANITDGTFRPQNVTRECGQIKLTAANFPYCISQSCNQERLSDYRTEMEKAINDVYKDLGIDCKVALEDSGAAFSATTNSMLFVASAGVASAILGLLV